MRFEPEPGPIDEDPPPWSRWFEYDFRCYPARRSLLKRLWVLPDELRVERSWFRPDRVVERSSAARLEWGHRSILHRHFPRHFSEQPVSLRSVSEDGRRSRVGKVLYTDPTEMCLVREGWAVGDRLALGPTTHSHRDLCRLGRLGSRGWVWIAADQIVVRITGTTWQFPRALVGSLRLGRRGRLDVLALEAAGNGAVAEFTILRPVHVGRALERFGWEVEGDSPRASP